MRRHPYDDPLTEVMAEFGIEDFEFGHTRKHRALSFQLNGKTHKIIMPTSPSDGVRGAKKAVSWARRFIRGLLA